MTRQEMTQLFDETFRRCMPQATTSFYTSIVDIAETSDSVRADVLLFDGVEASFFVFKPKVVGTYGFGCHKNGGAAFEWARGAWRRCEYRNRRQAA